VEEKPMNTDLAWARWLLIEYLAARALTC